ncbi:class A beta-lactamase [Aurantimonas sp. HBX-1]|uniref:class A beta-lactamase n=1 Tax=Aurantimonas sp. HBX-1 TaxID=2906072 RepID=UPI001EFF44A7|nr:class A beta-lactamase [Aurantimonas sp. HBX-1]UIJ73000.1 class A beta-lactamase [Aurantimonas sp. HBX-1]
MKIDRCEQTASRPSLSRRHLIMGASLYIAGILPVSAVAADDPIAAIERQHGGRLGLLALETGSGRTLEHRADERFLMCSTFKGLLAAHVLARVDAGIEQLDRDVPVSRDDLLTPSPVTAAHVSRGALPVEILCQGMVETSDNAAANLLMRASGGPGALTRFLRDLGDDVTRVDRYELEANFPDGELDTTTPRAIATSAREILLGNVLSPESRSRLELWMVNCQPGRRRLRAALPAGWVAGNRPGTNARNQTNDYALVRPPRRPPLLVAAYYDAPGLELAERETVLRKAGAAVVQWAA